MPETVANISVPAHITAVAYSEATRDIAYATNHSITWNLARGDHQLFPFSNVVAIAFSPDGDQLAYVTEVGRCGVFSRDPYWHDENNGLPSRSAIGNEAGTRFGIGWTSPTDLVVASSSDSKLFRQAENRLVELSRSPSDPLKDSQTLLLGAAGNALQVASDGWAWSGPFTGTSPHTQISNSPNEMAALGIGLAEASCSWWDGKKLVTFASIRREKSFTLTISRPVIATVPLGDRVAVWLDNGEVIIATADSRQSLGVFRPPISNRGWHLSPIFVESGRGLLLADADGRTFLFDADGDQLVGLQTQERDAPWKVDASASGAILACFSDGYMRYYEDVDSQPIREPGCFDRAVWDSGSMKVLPTGPRSVRPIPNLDGFSNVTLERPSDGVLAWRGSQLIANAIDDHAIELVDIAGATTKISTNTASAAGFTKSGFVLVDGSAARFLTHRLAQLMGKFRWVRRFITIWSCLQTTLESCFCRPRCCLVSPSGRQV